MNLFQLFFTFQGRINRAKYWLAVVIYLVIVAVLIGVSFAGAVSVMFFVLALIIYIPMIVSGVAVGIKRLHDRDKSGWWLLLFYLAPAVLNWFGTEMSDSSVGWFAAAAGFALSIWALVELGILRGTTGANRYGPDPLPL